MANKKRFVLEGERSGYTSSQQQIVHREVILNPEKYEHLDSIQYTDGTRLILSVRPARPREKVEEKFGYSSLIRRAAQMGNATVHVADISGAI